MAEAVVNVARRVNATVEEGRDHLDLSNCKLMSFPDGVFKVLSSVSENIRVITLADNEMKAISSKFFLTFTQLRELDLHGNILTKLPDCLEEMKHLTSIDLANNNFSAFPEKLTQISTLERINLEGNSISEIPLARLAAMPALKWLNVTSNPLDANTQSALTSPHKFEILAQRAS
ncbi:leucine-rich repeat-containing protein 20 isoform X2 [Syngnathoides biaculeatus]|uniref:leucine-rich repeat-containing protein 20 isoform X2 n=1 Tax=Syngnathoides biaculeatus TaxID=300417 RepID=UPI002ADDBFDD|nr:leucine-rich repeat-containing protein 20 isoform X2 [Syngnathoides biaculeatus]XP_061665378.1 leucine-rich repeat-containing protein 20 isoform X2 [Syngnathoides biaculeatus]XP_061665379.1 leucine-rich repeat-containing protein 20 isoform X2 [Syngnathoides biaculeatus]XP_061665380.1 leucine-rich repeat-containing protein 20 isoform X2 [Syngnathoides biaculeatus]XP_061665381.1 leucine-rich repeat-containing protein 20 isoform X2 [Syngnathoides biaculeatus]